MLSVDAANCRLGLSMKQLTADPLRVSLDGLAWETADSVEDPVVQVGASPTYLKAGAFAGGGSHTSSHVIGLGQFVPLSRPLAHTPPWRVSSILKRL